MSGSSTPPGWYPDPSNPSQQRYWDGTAWSDATAPGAPAAPAAPGYGVPGAPTTPDYGVPGAPAYGATQVGYGYAQAVGAPLAGFGARFGGWLIDIILVGIVTGIIGAVLGIEVVTETRTFSGGTSYEVNQGWNLFQFLLAAPYFLYFEGTTGQTLGKKVAGVKVVAADTLEPGIGWGKAGLRYVARIISYIPCFLGYFWMLWDDQKQTWHDKIASTKVVKA